MRAAAARQPLAAFLSRSTRSRMAASASATGSAAAADPGTAYKLLLSCPTGLPRSRVSVKFDQSFDRIPHPDAALEESISEIWNQRLEQNPLLYNGTKFRYGGNAWHYKDDSNQEYCASLHLGLTDYRTFVGTNLNPLWEKFLVPSEGNLFSFNLINLDDSVHCQHMSNPLGNGAIVETSDEKIIVLQRSYNVGEFPGYYVFPGGHSESVRLFQPLEIGIVGHQAGEEDPAHLNEKVLQEMFEGIIREVVEETGVPANSLTDPVFIGVSRREMNVRPTAFFFTKCDIDSSGVNELYSRAQDGYESTKLYAVSVVGFVVLTTLSVDL
ncbi:hypothetical protein PR202_gb25109 [Eleusine coracana subsp. coracana]|uniref:Nudix hydrolase domain-containing protein n=1 Tax=Eleusine coracana subsp. coracana TaxID=191504 RepID=A0AAV5FMQ3_ELECO|nr:hypothetical protein PR202_gb25109 [Eleusine coracana subsp. coracana]